MGVMGIAWKVVVGLVLLLPMTAYVVGSLVAAADEPPGARADHRRGADAGTGQVGSLAV